MVSYNNSNEEADMVEVVAANPLRSWRTARGVSVDHLAGMLGATPSTVLNWEGGRVLPSRSNLAAIAEILRVTESDLRREWQEWRERRARALRVLHGVELCEGAPGED